MTAQVDFGSLMAQFMQMQLTMTIVQQMTQAMGGNSGFGGLTKVLEDVLPLIIVMKLFEKF